MSNNVASLTGSIAGLWIHASAQSDSKIQQLSQTSSDVCQPGYFLSFPSRSQCLAGAPTTTLTSSQTYPAAGQAFTLTATVRNPAGTPTNQVTFKDGSTVLGFSTLSNGVATLVTSLSTSGIIHNITATYGGDLNTGGVSPRYLPSTSAVLAQLVIPYVTTINWTTTWYGYNFVNYQISYPLTVAVSAPVGIPTGQVTVQNGTYRLDTAVLTNGVANLTFTWPFSGFYSLTATYYGESLPGGSPLYLSATSVPAIFNVMPSPYVGCYPDFSPPRDLPVLVTTSSTLTVEKCGLDCVGYEFFGVQNGTKCFCGTTFSNNGISEDCNVACSGDSYEICGGSTVNSVYFTPQSGY